MNSMIKNKLAFVLGIWMILITVIILFGFKEMNSSRSQLIYPSEESNSSNLSHYGQFLVSTDAVYFSIYIYNDENTTTGFYKSDFEGKNITRINDLLIWGLREYQDKLYFIDRMTGYICKMDKDGSNYEPLFMATDYIIDFENGDIFYSQYASRSGVFKKDVNGVVTEVYDTFSSEFQIHKGYLYFVDQNEFRLCRTNLKTLKTEKISKTQLSSQYTLTDSYAYYPFGELYRLDLETLEETIHYDGHVNSLAINDGWIYFVTDDKEKKKNEPKFYVPEEDLYTSGTISKMKLDGSREQILCKEINPFGTFIHLAGDWIYITEPYETKILSRIGPNGEAYTIIDLPMD